MPNAAASWSSEARCGVPKTRSNGPVNAAGSSPAKIPPPSLLTTTTHRSGRGSPGPIARPGASCSSDRSPISANATAPGRSAACAMAAPAAVENVPSIPLAPLLAITRTSARGGMSRSTSRTDSEFPHHSSAPSGSAAASSRATSGSDRAPTPGSPRQSSSTAPAACVAAASARRHAASHRPGPAPGTPVSRIAAATSVAARCGSAHIPGPCATTMCRTASAAPGRPSPGCPSPGWRASASSADCGRVSPGRPAETMTAGRCAAMNSGDASRYW